MKGTVRQLLLGLMMLGWLAAATWAGSPGGSRATVTVTAYVLPKSTCALQRPSPGPTDTPTVRCQSASRLPVPIVRTEPTPSNPSRTVLTVLP